MMRAKMRVYSVTHFDAGEKLAMVAVPGDQIKNDGTDEDNTYALPRTGAMKPPAAQLEITIQNPEFLGKYKPGQTYFIDITSADVSPIIT